MKDKSIIIIGTGIAGLSAGCYGQMNGYRCKRDKKKFVTTIPRS